MLVMLSFAAPMRAHAVDSPRVRVMSSRVADLMTRGCRASPTLKALVDEVEASNLIVHVTTVLPVRHRPRGSLHFVLHAQGHRFLRILLDDRLPNDVLVALLAHELQHAVEIARAEWVVDQTTFESLYRAIGEVACETGERRHYDTRAARRMGAQVLAELKDLAVTSFVDRSR